MKVEWSSLHEPAVSARVGRWLGICFGIAFLTGLISHYAQAVSHPVPFPASPAWGYRVTQGLHIAAGTAAIPLLLVKLWAVYPRLFRGPPKQPRALLINVLERGSIGVLVAAAIFQLSTGLMNAAQWYPWSFSFRANHYAVAWVAIGALVLHIAVKLPVIREALGEDVRPQEPTEPEEPEEPAEPEGRETSISRRTVLTGAYTAAIAAVLATAGGTVPWLRQVSVFAVRTGEGPQGVPINRSAQAAGVTAADTSPDFRLVVAHGSQEVTLSRADLELLPQHTEELPIACVEGWSATGTWSGVRVRDLLALVDAPREKDITVQSMQRRGAFSRTVLHANFADDERTLLALTLAGEPLTLDHGSPCRIIAPNRPGVLQTKWVNRLEVRG